MRNYLTVQNLIDELQKVENKYGIIDVIDDKCRRWHIKDIDITHIYDGEDYVELRISNSPYWKPKGIQLLFDNLKYKIQLKNLQILKDDKRIKEFNELLY